MDEKSITVAEAVSLSQEKLGRRITSATIRNWIHDFGIGKKVGGRWYIDESRLIEILDGEVSYENQGRPKEK